MTVKHQAVSGVKWTSFSSFITSSLQLIQLAFLGRFIEPSDFGLMAMVMVVIGFAQLFADMGISNAIIHRQNTTHQELSSLYWLNIFSGLIIFFIIWFLSPTISCFYKEIRLINFLRITGLIFLIVPFGQQFQILFQKDLKFAVLAKVEIFSSTINTLITVSFAYAGHGVYSLIIGQIAGTFFRTIYLVSAGWKKWRPSFIYSHKEVKKFMRFGLYQMGERCLRYFTMNVDYLLIGRLLGPESLGLYSVAYQLMMKPIQIFNPVITKVAFPIFAKIQNNDSQLRNGYLQVIEIIALICMPVYFGMHAVSDSLIPLLLGHGWTNAVPIFNILVILGMFYSLGNPIGTLLLAKGRADIGFWFNVFAFILLLPAIITGSKWGTNGVAWSLVIVTGSILFPCGFFLRWFVVKLKPIEYIRSFYSFVFIAFLMAVLVKLFDFYLPIDSPALKICILSLSGAVFYFCFVLFFKKKAIINIVHMLWYLA